MGLPSTAGRGRDGYPGRAQGSPEVGSLDVSSGSGVQTFGFPAYAVP